MPRINTHEVPGAKSNGEINQTGRDRYTISTGASNVEIKFHSGAISGGLNGVTLEQLLQVVYQRLTEQQEELFDGESGGARLHVFRALAQLRARTEKRIAGGVEGTKQPTPGPTGQP